MIQYSSSTAQGLSRRRFVLGATAGLIAAVLPFPKLALASAVSNQLKTLSGKVFNLHLDYKRVNFTGQDSLATVVNASLPGPVLRWKEGESVTIRVTNNLADSSSIHWHGLILPTEMDGVPGISFNGIAPGTTFEYRFDLLQSGTYWYHSHSGFQEQTGVYGAIVIEPREADPVSFDREHVVMLSDWSDEAPEAIYAKLKKQSDYYNFRERTVADLFNDIKSKGVAQTWNDRAMWNTSRMSDRDLSDVTAYTYTYLMNGNTPEQGWHALFKKGEKVRLRFINSAAMSIFDVRIPGLKMTMVASDGQNIEPVTVDEFRIGVAETYDVIVEPDGDMAYCIFAQGMDRTGFAVGNLSVNPKLKAPIPAMDTAVNLGHGDMGMSMQGMDHAAMGHATMNDQQMEMPAMDDSQMNMPSMDHKGMNHGEMKMNADGHQGHQMSAGMQVKKDIAGSGLGKAGFGSNSEIKHLPSEYGAHVDMRASNPVNGLRDPGIGLRRHQQLYGRVVLNYGDLAGLHKTRDKREPSREIQLHLTGNMSRYMWSVNGIKFADAEPLNLNFGERVRITIVNDTMMTHPMHLHGMWSELETGNADYIPRKHTVLVHPGSKVSYLVTADAMGAWAYHCHLLFHMPGMFRKVVVS